MKVACRSVLYPGGGWREERGGEEERCSQPNAREEREGDWTCGKFCKAKYRWKKVLCFVGADVLRQVQVRR